MNTENLVNILGPLVYPPFVWVVLLGGLSGLLSTHFIISKSEKSENCDKRIFSEIVTDSSLWSFVSGSFGAITLTAIAMWLTNINLDPVFDSECGEGVCSHAYEVMESWMILAAISSIGGLASVKVLSSLVDGVTKTLDKRVSELTSKVQDLQVDDVKIHEELAHITAAGFRVRAAQLLRDSSYSAACKTYQKSIDIEPTSEGYAGVSLSLSYMGKNKTAYEYSCKSLELLKTEIESGGQQITEFEQGVIYYNHACMIHLYKRDSDREFTYVDEILKYIKLSFTLSKNQLSGALLEDSGNKAPEDTRVSENDFVDLYKKCDQFSEFVDQYKNLDDD